jgi:LL-diaminopimelate aminotransferase
VTYLDSTPANGYVPAIPSGATDLIYLCFPNNPTGAVATKAQLAAWIAYAKQHKAIILFDSAYEAYIRDPQIPHSIYELEGARDVAIEFRSFSKTAGFTGTRCAYTVIPKSLLAYDAAGNTQSVHALWNRRHSTKFNGVAYPIQKAAAAIYSPAGQQQTKALIDFYLGNAEAHPRGREGLGLPAASAATTRPTCRSTLAATPGNSSTCC